MKVENEQITELKNFFDGIIFLLLIAHDDFFPPQV